MTDQQLQQEFQELFEEMDAAKQKFEEAAAENRRTRRDADLEDRQDTEGDQPEREFEARVFLLIPHNARNSPTASFTRAVNDGQSGDSIPFTVDLTNTNVASVVVGSRDVNYRVSFEVVDTSDDGSVTVAVDTGRAGQSRYDVDTVYTPGSGDSLRNLTRDLMPNRGPVPLAAGTYDLSVSVDGQERDVAVLVVNARPSLTDLDAQPGFGSLDARSGLADVGRPAGDGPTDVAGTDVAAVDVPASGIGAVGGGGYAVTAGIPVDDTDGQSLSRGTTAAASRQRPLPRRPNARPPLRSSGLTVSQGGSETEFIQPGTRYTIECTVENGGGLAASTANVEVFVEHKPATATVDTDNGVFTAVRGSQSQRITGYTTLPPGHNIATLGFVGSPEPRNVLFRTVGAAGTVASDRTFSRPGQFGLKQSNITGNEFVRESVLRSQTFTMRLYWTTGIDLTKDKYTLQIESGDTKSDIDRKRQTALRNYIDVLENTAVQLTEVSGEFRSQQTNSKGPLNLSSTIRDATVLQNGRGRIKIPPRSSGTFSLQYTAPSNRGDTVLTALYARAYSLAPEDDPANWDRLDHTRSRFMGRNELYWQGITAT